MARPLSDGLTYYPKDTNMLDDSKLKPVVRQFGIKGYAIAELLLCKIYSNGYCCHWSEDEAREFAISMPEGITLGLVNDVVDELVKRGFFSKTIFDRFRILTSHGIQKRYLSIVRLARLKRPVIDKRLNCIKQVEYINWDQPEKVSPSGWGVPNDKKQIGGGLDNELFDQQSPATHLRRGNPSPLERGRGEEDATFMHVKESKKNKTKPNKSELHAPAQSKILLIEDFEKQCREIGEVGRRALNHFLSYRATPPHQAPISSPEVIQAIINQLFAISPNEHDWQIIITNTIAKSAKNIIAEMPKPVQHKLNNTLTPTITQWE